MVAQKKDDHSKEKPGPVPYIPRILKYMAEHGSDTIHGTKDGIKGDYKNVHLNFMKAERIGLLHKLEESTGRYPEYWLTGRGFVLALGMGADPDRLRVPAGISDEDSDLVSFETEVAKELGPDRYRTRVAVFYQSESPFPGSASLLSRLWPQKLQESDITQEEINAVYRVIRRHPAIREAMLKDIDEMRRRLGDHRLRSVGNSPP